LARFGAAPAVPGEEASVLVEDERDVRQIVRHEETTAGVDVYAEWPLKRHAVAAATHLDVERRDDSRLGGVRRFGHRLIVNRTGERRSTGQQDRKQGCAPAGHRS